MLGTRRSQGRHRRLHWCGKRLSNINFRLVFRVEVPLYDPKPCHHQGFGRIRRPLIDLGTTTYGTDEIPCDAPGYVRPPPSGAIDGVSYTLLGSRGGLRSRPRRSTMIDEMTQESLRVESDAIAGPYLMVTLPQLDAVRAMLDCH